MSKEISLLVVIILFISSFESREAYSQMSTPKEAGKSYCLVDPGTQVPIEKFSILSHWVASGKVVWNLKDAGNAVLWAAKFYDTRNEAVAKICSHVCFGGPGSVMQNTYLQDAKSMANMFLADIQEVAGNTNNLQLVSAHYSPCEIPSIQNQFRQIELVTPNTTNRQSREFEAEFTYKRDGKDWVVYCWTPVLSYDYLLGWMVMHTAILVKPIICTCDLSIKDEFLKQVGASVNSCVENPKWSELYRNLLMKLCDANNKRLANSREIFRRNTEEISRIQMESYRNRTETQERVTGRWSEYIREVEECTNPFDSDSKLVVSNNYDHAWVNRDNEIFYTDTSFNPNESSVFNAQEWKEVK